MINYERQKQEAYRYIQFLEKELKLNSFIRAKFEKGEILYSVNSPCLTLSMVLKVSDDEEKSGIVAKFEKDYNSKVYHCLEQGDHFVMLFVGSGAEERELPAVVGGAVIVFAAVYNVKHKFLEFGDVVLLGFDGALVRVG